MASKDKNIYFDEIDETFDAFKYDPATRTVKFPKDYTLLKLVKTLKDIVKRAQDDFSTKPPTERLTRPTITKPMGDIKKKGSPGFVLTPEQSMAHEEMF